MALRPRDFKSLVSTDSTTQAKHEPVKAGGLAYAHTESRRVSLYRRGKARELNILTTRARPVSAL